MKAWQPHLLLRKPGRIIMKIIRGFKVRGFILAAAFSAGLGFATSASAQAQHLYLVDLNSKTVIDLGSDVVANAINDSGQVVGDKSGHAFITGPDGVALRDIGTLGGAKSSASGINAGGQVVGWSDTVGGARHAFITGPDGVGMKDLGFPANINLPGQSPVPNSSAALAINDAGQVVGWFDGTFGCCYFQHAFITGPNGADMRDLSGDIGFLYTYTTGIGINDAGQVAAGSKNDDSYTGTVFITGPNGIGATPVDGLGGAFPFNYASGINGNGQVIGSAATGDLKQHAYVTGPDGVGTRDLGTLGGSVSDSSGINDAGQVVGSSEIAAGDYEHRHAFVADPHSTGMADLNFLVSPPPGVTFTGASAINNMGQVAAIGSPIPEPKTYAMLLAGLGLLGFIARRRQAA